MHTVTGKRIQEYRQGSNKCLSFTGGHLGNLSLMENNTTKQLYVVVDHLPLQVVSTSHPVILVVGLVTFYAQEIMSGSQLTVEISSGNHDLFILGQTACCLFHDRESHGHHLIEGILIDLQHLFVQLVYLVEDSLTLFYRSVLNLCLEYFYFLFFFFCGILYVCLNLLCLGT